MTGIEPIIAAIAGPGAKLVFDEIYYYIKSRHKSYSLKEILSQLNRDLESLRALKAGHERQVQNQRYDKDPSDSYKTWRVHVSEIDTEVTELIAPYNNKTPSKAKFIKRSRLQGAIARKRARVIELYAKGKDIDILVDKALEHVLIQPNALEIMRYSTLQNILKRILGCLNNNGMKAIGIYGKKGVGKTTIVKNLNNSKEVSELFEMVIFMTASACQNYQQLQEAIANRLKLNIAAIKGSADEITRRIFQELKNKKFLLILDDFKGSINLQELGIPFDDSGSKVVMTFESEFACATCSVNVTPIEVPRLEKVEAWQMFQDVASVSKGSDIVKIAKHVCEKCSGLPLLINKIANSFKTNGDNAVCWKVALNKFDERLRESIEHDPALKKLFEVLRFCYGELKPVDQKCFLYTSLYPADDKVYTDYLVECWVAEGFLDDVKKTYREARDNGQYIIRHLVNVSLLEKGERMIYVTMDTCMRQLALDILSEHSHYTSYVHPNKESKEPPESTTWMNAKWVSVIDTELQNLPTSQDCGVLETLLLQKNSKLTTIPETFFENKSNLLVLDLYSTGIREFPSSASESTSLKALYLNACKHLSKLPLNGESFQHLEVLDVRGSQVGFIPSCIGSLANLRCLRLQFRKNGNQSDHQDTTTDDIEVISKLKNLEELIIEVISNEDYEEWCKQVEGVMMQVALLEKLTTLNCSFPSSNILVSLIARREDLRDRKQFTSFQFFIGCHNTERPQTFQYSKDGITKYLKYHNGKKADANIGQILGETQAFELISHENMTTLSDLGIEELDNVRGFWIDDCNQVSTIVDGGKFKDTEGSILPKLEQLYLRNLHTLEYVFKGPLSLETFCELHTLDLENCLNLKSIFSRGANESNASILPNLKKLYMKNMQNLECVFIDPLPPGSFSELEILALEDCAKLGSIFSNGAIQNFSKLQTLKVQGCSKMEVLVVPVPEDTARGWDVLPMLVALEVRGCAGLKSLPFQKNKAAKLKCIKGEQEWWNKLKETNKEVHQQFEDIFVAIRG